MPAAALPSLQLSLQQPCPVHRGVLRRSWVQRCIRHALGQPPSLPYLQAAEITVRIVDNSEGRALNAGYRGKDYATNVLTFAYAQPPLIAADLVLCAPVVEQEAAAQRIELAHHYAHLLVHGTLHAQGWDHEDDESARGMEEMESAVMRSLGLPDPYARSRRAASRAK